MSGHSTRAPRGIVRFARRAAIRCEEIRLTCGDLGSCVTPDEVPREDTDARIDSTVPRHDDGTDSHLATDALDAFSIDALADAPAVDTVPLPDVGCPGGCPARF